MIYNKILEWNNLMKCPKCGSHKTKEKTIDFIEHTVCEFELVCRECGAHINYWGYGYYEEPTTRLEKYAYGAHPHFEDNVFKRLLNRIRYRILDPMIRFSRKQLLHS